MSNVIKKVYKNWTEYQIYASWWAAGAGDVTWPSSATNWHLAVFDWATWKLIKDWWELTNYSWVTKTISNNSVEIWIRTIVNQPSWNFTITKPATLKEWEEYVIRIINNESYTITLWSWITNPFSVNLATSPYATDQLVFIAINWELELQPLYTIS